MSTDSLGSDASMTSTTPSKPPLVSTLQINRANGRVEPVGYLERPQLWFDKGKPAVLFLATTVNQTSSYNVQILLK